MFYVIAGSILFTTGGLLLLKFVKDSEIVLMANIGLSALLSLTILVIMISSYGFSVIFWVFLFFAVASTGQIALTRFIEKNKLDWEDED